MTLELKHLAPYLPYRLMILKDDKIAQLTGLSNPYKTLAGYFLSGELKTPNKGFRESYSFYVDEKNLDRFKPILRPISDLENVIPHNDKKICLIEWIEDFYCTLDLHEQAKRLINDLRWLNQCDYMLVCHLIEYHFDVFGLIEQGLAIDINTIY